MLKKLAIAIASAFGLTLVNKTQAKVAKVQIAKVAEARAIKILKHPKLAEGRIKREAWRDRGYVYGPEAGEHMTVRQFLNHAIGRPLIAANPKTVNQLKANNAGVTLATCARRFSHRNGVKVNSVNPHFRSTFSHVRTYHPSALREAFEFIYTGKLTAAEIREAVRFDASKLTIVPKLAA
jgi:hypothetical protein